MSTTEVIKTDEVVIRFAGDSGDGMQITGTQFTETTAKIGNDLATFPDFPAEIRAPAGTRPGVSGFQVHFSSSDIHTPGDRPDVLVAMNPAALIVNYKDLKPGAVIVVNVGNFEEHDLKKANLTESPLEDGTLDGYRVIKLDVNARVQDALKDSPLSKKHVLRCKNFYVLGLMYWLYTRPIEPTLEWLGKKFAGKPELVDANQKALQAGFNRGSTMELFQGRYEVPAFEDAPKGSYRNILGNQALSLGLIAGAKLANLTPLLASYPITPATDILHQLSSYKHYGVITLQMEDEIAAVTAAIGGSYAGNLAMTTTSGPGMALKTEALGLAVMTELPLVVVNVQRAGPSTGMPTKVEQADLNQAIFGRNSEAPIPVLAASTPSDCFECAVEACRIAVEYMTPVILLSDNYLAAGSEPWKLPTMEELKPFPAKFHTDAENFQPFSRNEKGARPWALPGTPGLQHRLGGLEKEPLRGEVSYEPDSHETMTYERQNKIMGIAKGYKPLEMCCDENAELLVVSWGSPFGQARSAVERSRKKSLPVAHLQLRHLWPLPLELGDYLSRFKKVLVPELNLGQLSRLLRGEYPGVDIHELHKMRGKPFNTDEIQDEIERLLGVES
jgi:2-oxoglutarate/2-oxoacid ferredoxin oxidoreductase subunit alpha